MTEAKHTTGPWTVGSSTGHNASHVYCGDDAICTVYGIFAHQSVAQVANDPHCIEGMANARLIAAAPDMLAELRDILDWALVEKAALPPQEIEHIRAVVAKATGAA